MFEGDPTPSEHIERLEAEIDELREAVRRSRGLAAVGRACAFFGAALLVGLLFGPVTVMPVRMIVGMAAGIGGLVLMGSSVGSTQQLELSRSRERSDASLIEINPLIVTKGGALVALDAKLDIEANALFRQKDMAALRDPGQEDPMERRASEHDLNYVSLDGNIACMVNGAGLAMATMDLIKLHGGQPANFLDVGGGATSERVTAAFQLILSNPQRARDPGQHLRRHRALRPDRRRHHQRGEERRRQCAGGGAARGHQCARQRASGSRRAAWRSSLPPI